MNGVRSPTSPLRCIIKIPTYLMAGLLGVLRGKWVHDALMPYLKIGHLGANPGTDYYPLNDLYPVEPSKGEE